MAFVVDDVLLAPIRGVAWLARKVHEAAGEALAEDREEILQRLRELYMMLDTGAISEEEFQEREGRLLDRLDQLEGEGPQEAPAAEEAVE